MNELYRREICITCINDKCTNRIKLINKQDIFDNKIVTTRIIKCDDYRCESKRKKENRK